jgi:hypothetical protein
MDLGAAGDSFPGGDVEVPCDAESLALSEDEKRATWAKLRKCYEPRLGQGVTIQSLACAQSWVASRSADCIDDFISLSWDELLETKGLGKKKCDLLLKIFYDAMSRDPQGLADEDPGTSEPSVSQNPTLLSKLTDLAIPATFPISLCRFSGRVKESCKNAKVDSVGDLLLLVESNRIESLNSHYKIGVGSIQEIRDFCESLNAENCASLANVLPYDSQRARLSLVQAIRCLLNSLGEQTRLILKKRLVMGNTLEAIGEPLKLSRERIRQLVSRFLEDLARYLEWFEEDRTALFDKLKHHASIVEAFEALQNTEDASICAAAIRNLFESSQEGQDLADQYEALFESWVIELRKRVGFYLSQIHLTEFLRDKGNEFLAEDFTGFGRRTRAFNLDEETDIIAPPAIGQKGLVAALLWEAEKDVEADVILGTLEKLEVGHFERDQLRRNYYQWKADPDFPPHQILFPKTALVRQTDVIERSVVAPRIRPKAQHIRPSPSCSSELQDCNRIVTQMIGRFSTPTILGLLPFSSDEQFRILHAVIAEHGNSVTKLRRLLELSPGAIAYSLAFAAGSGMESSAFWEPIERGLQIDINQAARPGLSEDFRRAVQTLGLIEASLRLGNHLWPILFQAGIVPQFVPQLAVNISRFLEGKPPPDYQDEEELTQFALAIRDRIPKAWVRLRELLETSSGRRSCAAILEAHRAADFDLLPPHLRQDMREAFKGVTRHFFATPYLTFQVHSGQVGLCLPRQPSKLLTPASHWQVGDIRTFAATETSIVPVEELAASIVTVRLKNLAQSLPNWCREFSLLPSDTQPIQIFLLPRGKGIRVEPDANGNVALPFGDYAILVGVEIGSNIEEGWQQIPGDRQKWIEYSAFPGQIALEIVLDRTLRFVPKDEPAILVIPNSGGRIPTVDDEPIYFGQSLSVSLHLPSEGIAEDSECVLVLTDGSGMLEESFLFLGADLLKNPESSEVEIDPQWIAGCVEQLACGIHQLTFRLSSHRRVIRRSVWFWKGFDRTRGGFGFICASPVSNLDFAASVGIRKHQNGIALDSSFSGSEIVLALNAPRVSLRLPRPGACITLQNPSTGESVPIAAGRSLEFSPDDMSRLVVEINETLPCELLTGQTIVRTFEKGVGSFTQRVQGFFHEFGDALTLSWRVQNTAAQHLLTITKLTVANGLVFTLNEATMSYRGAFKLSKEYEELSVVYRNLFNGQKCQSCCLDLKAATTVLPMAFFGDLHFRIRESGDDNYIEFFRNQSGMENGLFSLEFLCRRRSTDDWTPLRIYESTGVTGSRVFMVSEPLVSDGSWWSSLVCAAWKNDLGDSRRLPEISSDSTEAEFRGAFERIGYVLDYTYCGDAWDSIKWIRGVYGYLCAHCANHYSGLIASEAVNGLVQRAENADALYRPLVFGSLGDLWYATGKIFEKLDCASGRIKSSFEILSVLNECSDLSEFFSLPISSCVDIFPLVPYLDQNAKKYNYGLFFKDVANAVLQDAEDSPQTLLLSRQHFRHCFWTLRRNVETLLTVRDFEDPALLGRRSAVTSLLTFGNRFIVLEGFLKAKMAIPNAISFDIDVYSPSPGPEIRRCILLLTALSRLVARGQVTSHEFHLQLRNIFGGAENDPQNIQKGMTLLLCLAPEFFSCAMLLWDIILCDQP